MMRCGPDRMRAGSDHDAMRSGSNVSGSDPDAMRFRSNAGGVGPDPIWSGPRSAGVRYREGMRPSVIVLALLVLPLAACRSCACQGEPPIPIPLGDSMRIPVEIDGAPAVTIDRHLLDITAPDYVDAERKAWRLQTLLGSSKVGSQATIEVDDAQGQRVVLAGPAELGAGRDPIVTVNRQGDLRMALGRADDEDVFAAFHGRG
jgi:hypothetical protein